MEMKMKMLKLLNEPKWKQSSRCGLVDTLVYYKKKMKTIEEVEM